MKLRLSTVLIFVLCCAVGAACGDRKPPTAPTGTPTVAPPPVPPPPPAPVPTPPPAGMIDTRTVAVVSGADGAPVVGATIRIGGATYVTDAAGHPGDGEQYRPHDSHVDVEAEGFLRRETIASYDQRLILWPAGNEQEREAIRRMVYARDGLVTGAWNGFIDYPLTVSAEGLPPGGSKVWSEVIAEISRTLPVKIEFYSNFQYDPNEVNMRILADPPQCTPVVSWGFCRDSNPNYELYWMPLERTTDPQAVKRLIFSFFLGANPLLGFMNVESPADTLSPLELQTIRMLMQRPRKNRWPDSDR